MRKFKDGFWLVMQCKSAKFTLILGLVIFCYGFVMAMVDSSEIMVAFFSVYSWMFIGQFACQQELAAVTAASPMRRYMSVTFINILSGFGTLLSVIMMLVAFNISGSDGYSYIMSAFAVFIIEIYIAISYKFYWIGTIVFALVFIVAFGVAAFDGPMFSCSVPMGMIAMIAVCFLGWLVGAILRVALYKFPNSPIMYKSLERQMR